MYDTVNFWVDGGMITYNPENIGQYLQNPKDIYDRDNNTHHLEGYIGSYFVKIYDNRGISLMGSLSTYYLPSNTYTLTLSTTKNAIEKLSDELHVDIKNAKVTRVDVSTVIPTTQPPSYYYPYLGDKPYFVRLLATKDTLYYKTQKRNIIFYDKIKDAIQRGAEIPTEYLNENLLRYEVRYMKELKRQLKTSTNVTGALLTNSDFYYSIIQNWKNEFDSIQKLNSIITMTENIKTPKDAVNVLIATLIQQQGGQKIINEFMNHLKCTQTFPDAKYYTRAKNSLNEYLKLPNGMGNEPIREIEKSIHNIAKHAV